MNDIDCRNCEYYLFTDPKSISPAWCTCPKAKGPILSPMFAPICQNFTPKIPRDKYGRVIKQEVENEDHSDTD